MVSGKNPLNSGSRGRGDGTFTDLRGIGSDPDVASPSPPESPAPLQNHKADHSQFGSRGSPRCSVGGVSGATGAEHDQRLPDPSVTVLCCLGEGNPVRRGAAVCYVHPLFANLVLGVIMLNSLQMLLVAARVPAFVEAELACDAAFTALFGLEMCVKVLALGFAGHRGAYLRSTWNAFDCLVVIASVVSLAGVGQNVSVIRLLRVLRPLRSMSRVEGMRSLMNALFASVPKIIDNVLLMLFLIVTFAILGLQMFSGVLHRRCYITSVEGTPYEDSNASLPALLLSVDMNCGGMIECADSAGEAGLSADQLSCAIDDDQFQDQPLNYDNIFRAVLLVFKVISGDNWPDDMHKLMRAYSGWTCVFYGAVVVFGTFFGTNLFLAVLIDAYYEQHKDTHGTKAAEDIKLRAAEHFLHLAQGHREAAADKAAPAVPPLALPPCQPPERPPQSAIAQEAPEERRGTLAAAAGCLAAIAPARALVERFVSSRAVQWGMLIATIVNVLALAVDHYPIERGLEKGLSTVNMTCTGIFTVEILLKFFARGVVGTLRDPYDAFDFLLVALAVPDLVSGSSSAFTALRAFRILRAVRLVRRLPSLANLFLLVGRSISGGMYVGLVMLLQIFIFSILGMQLFAGAYPEDARLRFDTLWEAAVTCFVIITGENWATAMSNAMLGTSAFACLFFLMLFVTGNYVLVNVFTAIILDNMQDFIGGGDNGGAELAETDEPNNRSLRDPSMNESALHALLKSESTGPVTGNWSSVTVPAQRLGRPEWSGIPMADEVSDSGLSATPRQLPMSPPGPGLHGSSGAGFRSNGTLQFPVALNSPPGEMPFPDQPLPGPQQSPLRVSTKPPSAQGEPSPPERHRDSYASSGTTRSSAHSARSDSPGELMQRQLSSRVMSSRGRVKMFRQRQKDDAAIERRRKELTPFEVTVRHGPVDQRKPLGIVLERAGAVLAIRVVHPGPCMDAGVEPGMVLLEVQGRALCAPEDMEPQLGFGGTYGQLPRVNTGLTGQDKRSSRGQMGQDRRSSPGLGQDRRCSGRAASEHSRGRGDFEVPAPAEVLHWMDGLEGDKMRWRVRREERFAQLHWHREGKGGEGADDPCCSLPPPPPLEGRALGLFAPDNALRLQIARVVTSTQFDYAIAGVIAVNVIFLALEYPGAGPGLRKALDVSEIVFTVVFCIEMALKVLAMGLVQREPPVEVRCARVGCLSTSIGAELRGGQVMAVSEGSAAQAAGLEEGYLLTELDGEPVTDPEVGETPFPSWLEGGELVAHFRRDDVLDPYLCDHFNQIDFVVVLTSVLANVIRQLRPFRALRTLRLLVRSQSIAIVLEALVRCLPAVTQGVMLSGFLYFVFGILGVQLFKGRLYTCSDPDIEYEVNCTGSWHPTAPGPLGPELSDDPEARSWERLRSHFDHIAASILTLFEVATGEGWDAIMFDTVDARSVGQGPQRNANPAVAIFFIVFFMLANFFAMQLIVGLIIQHFLKEREELDSIYGGVFLTAEQRSYIAAEVVLRKVMFATKASEPEHFPMRYCYLLVQHPVFDNIITAAIVVNMLILSTSHYRQTGGWSELQSVSGWIFAILFAGEAAVKLIGLGARGYFASGWNRFDFFVVCAGLLGQFVSSMQGLNSLRVLRVGRLFRLVGKAKGLQELFNTIFTDENIFFFLNVSTFLLSIFFIFAVAGVDLFGTLKHSHGIDQTSNFETVPNALLVLLSISTTEGWLDVRQGATNTEGECGEPGQGDCASKWGILYFLLFIVVGSFVLLNVFSAVVVELYQKEDKLEEIKPQLDAFEELRARWAEHFGDVASVDAADFVRALILPDPEPPETRALRILQGAAVARRSLERSGSLAGSCASGQPPPRRRASAAAVGQWRFSTPHSEGTAEAQQDRGLLPPLLRRARLGSDQQTLHYVELPQYSPPTTCQVLNYLASCPLPLCKGCTVRYSDVVYCLAAKAFGVDSRGVRMLAEGKRSIAVHPADDEFVVAHWYAVDRLVARWQARKSARLQSMRLKKTAARKPRGPASMRLQKEGGSKPRTEEEIAEAALLESALGIPALCGQLSGQLSARTNTVETSGPAGTGGSFYLTRAPDSASAITSAKPQTPPETDLAMPQAGAEDFVGCTAQLLSMLPAAAQHSTGLQVRGESSQADATIGGSETSFRRSVGTGCGAATDAATAGAQSVRAGDSMRVPTSSASHPRLSEKSSFANTARESNISDATPPQTPELTREGTAEVGAGGGISTASGGSPAPQDGPRRRKKKL